MENIIRVELPRKIEIANIALRAIRSVDLRFSIEIASVALFPFPFAYHKFI